MTSSNRTKMHTVYKNSEGKRVPGVTTIIGIMDKPALLKWAWQCGVDGLDYTKVRDEAADIGTIAHEMIMCFLKKQELDTTEYPSDLLAAAQHCLESYKTWAQQFTVKPIFVELPLVSEKMQVGGTADLYCLLNGKPTLVDFKTGKGVYSEHFIQVAAYRAMIEEIGYPVEQIRILHIPRLIDETLSEKVIDHFDTPTRMFVACRELYRLKNELNKEFKQ